MQILIALLVLFFSAFASASTKVTFVSPAKMRSIEASFMNAKAPGLDVLNTAWKCNLYGKKSLTFKEKTVALYQFSKSTDGTFKNKGSHITKLYEKTKQGLVATRSAFIDTVRVLDSNRLVSRLMLKAGRTISYSICRK